jgi:hypothetical protein
MEIVGTRRISGLTRARKDAQATSACLRSAPWSLERFLVGNRRDEEGHGWHELFFNKRLRFERPVFLDVSRHDDKRDHRSQQTDREERRQKRRAPAPKPPVNRRPVSELHGLRCRARWTRSSITHTDHPRRLRYQDERTPTTPTRRRLTRKVTRPRFAGYAKLITFDQLAVMGGTRMLFGRTAPPAQRCGDLVVEDDIEQ